MVGFSDFRKPAMLGTQGGVAATNCNPRVCFGLRELGPETMTFSDLVALGGVRGQIPTKKHRF